jgi:hypothetical protein
MTVATLVLACTVLADDRAGSAPPTTQSSLSPTAEYQAAVAKELRAEQDALNAYRNAVLAARRDLVEHLKAEQQRAIQEGRPDDANNFGELLNSPEQRFLGQSAGWTATIQATNDWEHVITLPRGKYLIAASGSWSDNPGRPLFGPEGVKNDPRASVDNLGALVARVNGNVRLIGKSAVVDLTDEQNYVEMEMSDSVHSDNRGSVDVVITDQPVNK